MLYGCLGGAGKVVCHEGSDPEPLRQVVRESLRRRLTAPTRIGCAYTLRQLKAAGDIDVEFWLPANILSVFLRFPSLAAVLGADDSVPETQVKQAYEDAAHVGEQGVSVRGGGWLYMTASASLGRPGVS